MTQSLSNIVNITVQVSPTPVAAGTFNTGLIIGESTVVLSTTTRTATYSSTSAMTAAGWTGTEPEYKAAELYFQQIPRPAQVVIGYQDAASSETPVAAVTACRSANTAWYGVYGCGWAATDIENVAAYVETMTPVGELFYDSSDASVTAGTTPNVGSVLQGDKYQHSIGIWSSVTYAGAALMGLSMGSNTGLANSAFTLNWKSLVGVTAEPLTDPTEYDNITGYNMNVYTDFGSSYELLSPGVVADGTPYDQILNTAQLTGDLTTAAVNALTTTPKIPQTSDGVQMLVSALQAPCESARTRGVIAAGTWTAAPVLTLQTGQTLPRGYVILADSIANQSQADRTARKSPPIYVCVKLAGAIEHVVIGLIINQ